MAKWSQFDVIAEASKYPTRSAFRKGNNYAYRLALVLQMMDALFPVSNPKLERAIDAARTMNNGALFRKLHPAMARMLHRYGYDNTGSKINFSE